MRDIIQCMSVLYKVPNQGEVSDGKRPEVKDSSSTQTEIIAVHTPQVENLPFPFANKLPRPSTLPLNDPNGTSSTSIRKISEREGEETTDTETKKSNVAVSTSTDNKGDTPEISAKGDEE